jgi:Pyruvate/2-oxoacid:ferredoxin oxidoreductase delta subunit
MSKPGIFFNSGFQPAFDPDECVSCNICIERCPPEALSMEENHVPVVNLDRCFGCAVGVARCPDEAIRMVNKPGFQEIPKDPKALREAISG